MYMYHQLKMSGKIMQVDIGGGILIVNTTGLQIRH